KLGIPRYEAETLRLIALAHEETGHLDDAARALEKALRVLQGSANRLTIVTVLCDLGRVRTVLGEPERAEPLLARAVSLADSLGNPILLGTAERTLGRACAVRGQDERALALFDRAIQRGRAFRSQSLLEEALVDRARHSRARGRVAEADSFLTDAIEVVESVRGLQRGDEIRVGILAKRKRVYVERVATLYELGVEDPAAHEEAFRVAERSRARALLDALSGTRVPPGAGLDPALLKREQRLVSRLSAVQVQISKAVSAETWDASRIDSLEALLQRVGREYGTTLEEIAARSPAYGAHGGGREPLGLAAVRQRVLGRDQVLLEYLTGQDESYLFVVGSGRFRLVRIPVSVAEIAARVGALRQALRAGGGGSAAASDAGAVVGAAKDLHAFLIGPVVGDLDGATRLLIVPDGPLFYLPFGVLHDATSFLIQRHAIAYAPSASVLDPAIPETEPLRPQRLLAVANPASFRSTELLAAMRDAERWRFAPLPYAEEEVRRIARHFSDVTLLTSAQATEERVKAGIHRATHVHFATHGLLNEEEPILSGLSLAQDEDPREDGVLQVHEILKLHLAADLVVLSACNTGLGRLADGEGVMGLTRSFLYAGARSLLVSLWEVGDRPTVDIMDAFYRGHLEEGLRSDAALREAQLASMAAGHAPREWAAFVIMGRVDEPPGGLHPAVLAVSILAATTLAVLLAVGVATRLRGRRSKAAA
ncbi:MAG: CHAT domain-containing protein, partial [Candidatus Krumholzibacteriia bacterium]